MPPKKKKNKQNYNLKKRQQSPAGIPEKDKILQRVKKKLSYEKSLLFAHALLSWVFCLVILGVAFSRSGLYLQFSSEWVKFLNSMKDITGYLCLNGTDIGIDPTYYRPGGSRKPPVEYFLMFTVVLFTAVYGHQTKYPKMGNKQQFDWQIFLKTQNIEQCRKNNINQCHSECWWFKTITTCLLSSAWLASLFVITRSSVEKRCNSIFGLSERKLVVAGYIFIFCMIVGTVFHRIALLQHQLRLMRSYAAVLQKSIDKDRIVPQLIAQIVVELLILCVYCYWRNFSGALVVLTIKEESLSLCVKMKQVLLLRIQKFFWPNEPVED